MTPQQLSDVAIRHALLELSDGPDGGALLGDVLVVIDKRRQIGRPWLPWQLDRRWVLAGLAALLLIGGVVVAGMRPSDHSFPPRGPFLFMLEHWNGLVDPDSIVELTAIDPSTGAAVSVLGAPRDATNFHWAPDGSRVVFLSRVAQVSDRGLGGPHPQLLTTGLSVANRDWRFQYAVELQHPIEEYDFGDLGDGVVWAPSSERFAVGSSNGTCIGDPDACVADGSIDLFSLSGTHRRSIAAPRGNKPRITWSYDGGDLGWYQFECPDSQCSTTSFTSQNWVGIGGDTVADVPGIGGVRWAPDGRLVAYVADSHGVTSVFTIGVDGADRRDVAGWAVAGRSVALSPDGGSLLSLDPDTGALRVDDLRAGKVVEASVPAKLDLAGWSPDGQWIVLWTSSEEDFSVRTFFAVNADGTGFRELGQGENFSWAPASVLSGG